jgi:hypothetical protein
MYLLGVWPEAVPPCAIRVDRHCWGWRYRFHCFENNSEEVPTDSEISPGYGHDVVKPQGI